MLLTANAFVLGTYFILVYGFSSFSGVSLRANILTTEVTTSSTSTTTAAPATTQLTLNVPKVGEHLPMHQANRYSITIGTLSELNILTSATTGDADLYVKRGSLPSRSRYDKRSAGTSSNERVHFQSPSSGTTSQLGVLLNMECRPCQ